MMKANNRGNRSKGRFLNSLSIAQDRNELTNKYLDSASKAYDKAKKGIEEIKKIAGPVEQGISLLQSYGEMKARAEVVNSFDPESYDAIVGPWKNFKDHMGKAEGLVDKLPGPMQNLAMMPFDTVQRLDPFMEGMARQQVGHYRNINIVFDSFYARWVNPESFGGLHHTVDDVNVGVDMASEYQQRKEQANKAADKIERGMRSNGWHP